MSQSRRSRKTHGYLVVKPQGKFTQRVQAVGPDHFGIVAVDGAKARSKFLLCDFYGEVLIPPTPLPHTQADLQAAIARIRQTMRDRRIEDSLVAIERTGVYHRPVQHAFRQANFDTRLVHPFASKQFRQPADAGNKTDDTDLAAIFRAALNGFGLIDPELPDVYQQLQWLGRERRDLVKKTTCLRCQIRECLHQLMPGYAELFGQHLFDSQAPMPLAHATGSAQAVLDAGLMGLRRLLPDDTTCRLSTFDKVYKWAATSTPAHPQAPLLRLTLRRLDDDRLAKLQEIRDIEQRLGRLLVHTPYVILLALPGINVITASEFAGEGGPPEHYADANRITGRAGLAPCRYQSDQVDRQGALLRRGNRRLRAVLMHIADNLVRHCRYFEAKAADWDRLHKDPRWIRVKVAKSFSRLAFVLLTGRCVVPHPACLPRNSIYEKVLTFQTSRAADMAWVLDDLDAAARQLGPSTRREQLLALEEMNDHNRRRRGPVKLASVIPLVLARLGVHKVQSKTEGEGLD